MILVEGISEKLLLPVFSRKLGGDYDLEKRGIEIININGVAFEHFAKLFNHDNGDLRLNCRCAILTDDDRDFETEEISSRAKSAKTLAKNLLRVELAQGTFEIELFKTGDNKDLLLSIFSEMHPRAASNIEIDTDIDKYAKSFLDKLVANKAKAELAHRLSLRLEDPVIRDSFAIPLYIEKAIKWVVKGE